MRAFPRLLLAACALAFSALSMAMSPAGAQTMVRTIALPHDASDYQQEILQQVVIDWNKALEGVIRWELLPRGHDKVSEWRVSFRAQNMLSTNGACETSLGAKTITCDPSRIGLSTGCDMRWALAHELGHTVTSMHHSHTGLMRGQCQAQYHGIDFDTQREALRHNRPVKRADEVAAILNGRKP